MPFYLKLRTTSSLFSIRKPQVSSLEPDWFEVRKRHDSSQQHEGQSLPTSTPAGTSRLVVAPGLIVIARLVTVPLTATISRASTTAGIIVISVTVAVVTSLATIAAATTAAIFVVVVSAVAAVIATTAISTAAGSTAISTIVAYVATIVS